MKDMFYRIYTTKQKLEPNARFKLKKESRSGANISYVISDEKNTPTILHLHVQTLLIHLGVVLHHRGNGRNTGDWVVAFYCSLYGG